MRGPPIFSDPPPPLPPLKLRKIKAAGWIAWTVLVCAAPKVFGPIVGFILATRLSLHLMRK